MAAPQISCLLGSSNLQSVHRFANCGSRESANPLRKFLHHPDGLDSRLQNMFFCETCAAVGGRVEPVGRTCAANVGESELASLSDQGVEGVPNNLPMPD